MAKKRNFSKYISLLLMIVISLGAQILSVAKSSIIAGTFGASQEMDAFNFANSIVTFLFSMITAAIPTVIMPHYVREQKQARSINSFITVVYGALFLIAGVLVFARYPLVGLISRRGADYTSLVCRILLILMFAQSLGAVNYVTVAYFQSQGRYNLPKIINLISQLLVVGVLLLCGTMTVVQYAWVIAGGLILGFALDLGAALRLGWRYSPALDVREPETAALLRSFFPILLSTGVYQLSLMTDSVITERLEEGMITILAYSSQISSIVNSVVVGNLQIYIYPRIIRNIKSGAPQALFWKQSEALHCIVWLVIAGFITVGREGVAVLFEHGAFTAATADAVYTGAAIYIFGQQFNIVRDILYKFFYAKGNTKIPSQNSILVSISNILISLALISLIGFYGVIIGTICASCLSLGVILFRFHKQYGFAVRFREILWPYIKNAAFGVASILAVMQLKSCLGIQSDILSILVYGSATVLCYGLLHGIFNRKLPDAFRAL